MINSRFPWLVSPKKKLLQVGLPYSEVTEAICRVPSTSFSQAPRYTLPVHVCPFRVRSNGEPISWTHSRQLQSNKELQFTESVTTTWFRNICLISSTTAFALVLGPTNPAKISFTQEPLYSATESFTLFVATHVSIRTSDTSKSPHGSFFNGLQNVPLPDIKFENFINSQLRYVILAPLHLRRKVS